MQNFFKFEQDSSEWMPQIKSSPTAYQYNPLSFGQQSPQTAPTSPLSASSGLMNSGGASQPVTQPQSELQQFLNDIGKGTKLAKKVKDAYDNWKAEGSANTPTTNNGIFDPNATADPYANVNITPPTDIMSGNNGLLSGGSADPYANVNLTPPEGLMSGNNGVLDPNASADPYANVNAGGFDPSLAGNLTFQTGQSGLTGAAGAVTLPEGTMQFADGSMVLADGTTIGADGAVSGAAGGTANAGSGGLMSGIREYGPYATAAMGAYDMVANHPTGSHAMADFGGMVALANPVLGAAFAAPALLESIFGGGHSIDFNNVSPESTLYQGDDGYSYFRGGTELRYNPESQQWEYPRLSNWAKAFSVPDLSEGGTTEYQRFEGWLPAPIEDGWVREGGRTFSDYYNLNDLNNLLNNPINVAPIDQAWLDQLAWQASQPAYREDEAGIGA